MTLYYARLDANGVLCVDELQSDNPTEEQAGHLAESFPETIYFEYAKPEVWAYYSMEVDDLGVLCVTPQHDDESRVADWADRNPDVVFFRVQR